MIDINRIIPKCFGDDHQKRLLLVREQCNARQVAANTYSHQNAYNTAWYSQADAFSRRS